MSLCGSRSQSGVTVAELAAGALPIVDGHADSTGATNATATLQALINAGTAISLKPTGRYALNTPLDFSAGGTLIGNGATLVQNANAAMITATAVWGTPVTVSALSVGTYTFPLSGAATSSVTATIGTHSLVIGDRVRLVSSDTPIGGDTSGGSNAQRTAQFFIVGDTTSTTVILPGVLRDPMTANIRLVKVPTVAVNLSDVKFASANTSYNTDAVTLIGVRPRLERLRLNDLNGQFIRLRGCYDISANDIECHNGPNTVTDLSYGISVEACEGGVITNLRGTRLRHLFTTLGLNVSATTALVSYMGRTRDITVIGGQGFDCWSAAFDTHPFSENITFVGCVATQGRSGNGGSNTKGFQLRGRNERAVGCTSAGHQWGAEVWADIAGNGVNCSFENCTFVDCELGLYLQDDVVGGNNCVAAWRGGRIEASVNAIKAVTAKRMTIDGGADLAVTGSGAVVLYNGSTTQMVMRGGVIDVSMATSAKATSANSGFNIRVANTAFIGTFAELHDSARTGTLTPNNLDLIEAVITSLGGTFTKLIHDPLSLGVCTTFDAALISTTTAPGANTARWMSVLGWGKRTSTLNIYVGVQAGNIEVAVYASTGYGTSRTPGARKATTGSIACPAVGLATVTLTSAVDVMEGDYFAIATDSATAAFGRGVASPISATVEVGRFANKAAAFPMPNPAAATNGSVTPLWVSTP